MTTPREEILLDGLRRIAASSCRPSRRGTLSSPLVPIDDFERLQLIARSAIEKAEKTEVTE